MPTFSWGGMSSGVRLYDLLNEAGTYSRTHDFTHLGSSTTIQNSRVAEMVNRAIDDFLDANPVLGLVTANISMVDGTQTYAIPTALRRIEIKRIYYSDSGEDPSNDLRELTYLGRAQIEQLSPDYRNGEKTALHPDYWGFDRTGANIIFYPMPDEDHTMICEYRQESASISGVNVTTSQTTVDQDSAAAATTLYVAATTGLDVGSIIVINRDGTREEIGTVSSIAAGVSVTLSANLTYTHTLLQADVVDNFIAEIPSEFQYILALHIGSELAFPLKPEMYDTLMARYNAELARTQRKLMDQYPSWKAGISGDGPGRKSFANHRLYDFET